MSLGDKEFFKKLLERRDSNRDSNNENAKVSGATPSTKPSKVTTSKGGASSDKNTKETNVGVKDEEFA